MRRAASAADITRVAPSTTGGGGSVAGRVAFDTGGVCADSDATAAAKAATPISCLIGRMVAGLHYDLRVFSRYFVIALAAGLGIFRATQHAYPDAVMLVTLALGLTLLRLADTQQRPILRQVAWFLFAISLVALGIVFQRNYLR